MVQSTSSIKKEYVFEGKCIWCKESKPEATFYTKPHTIPKRLNAQSIGFDICDQCNQYFGSDNKDEELKYSVDKVLKEVFNVHEFMLTKKKDSNSWKIFKSQFFNYYHKSRTLKIKVDFRKNLGFEALFTRQFKRGVYYIFLQELHLNRKCALDIQYEPLRQFVRYNIGDMPLFHLKNNNGIRLTESMNKPKSLGFNDFVMSEIKDFGFYHLQITGLNFFLAINPAKAANHLHSYLIPLSRKLIGSGFVFKELIELKKISQIDFMLEKWR